MARRTLPRLKQNARKQLRCQLKKGEEKRPVGECQKRRERSGSVAARRQEAAQGADAVKGQNELEALVQGMEHEETQGNKRVMSRK